MSNDERRQTNLRVQRKERSETVLQMVETESTNRTDVGHVVPGSLSGPRSVQGAGRLGGNVQAVAAAGVQGSGTELPHLGAIQASFGPHDVSNVQAHVGGAAGQANQALGSEGYTTGSKIAFKRPPNVKLAAHEAAHVVQQRRAIQLKGGVGQVGDPHEKNADAVADRVVQGRSAVDLLGGAPSGGSRGAAAGVQRQVQFGIWDTVVSVVSAVGQAVVEVVEDAIDAVDNWINLEPAKRALLTSICDTAWVRAAVADVDLEANPKHSAALNAEYEAAIIVCQAEAIAFAARIAGCESLDEVATLSSEVDAWKTARATSLREQIDEIIKRYLETEKGWLQTYKSHAAITKAGANPNKGYDTADVSLDPSASAVTLTTKLKWKWKYTADAKKAKIHTSNPWTAAQKTEFKQKVQKQLDAVWGPGNQMSPFKLTAPEDFMLKKEGDKWSGILLTFRGVIADDPAGGTDMSAWRSAPGEGTRANSANLYDVDVDNPNVKYKKNKDGSWGVAKDSEQHVMAHEFGHFGMGLPDEYTETSDERGTAKKDQNWGGKFPKVIASYDKKIADCDKIIRDNGGDTEAEKKKRRKAQADRRFLLADKLALLHPTRENMHSLAPQNRPPNAPPVPAEAFAQWGGHWDPKSDAGKKGKLVGDIYAPGRRTARGQRENEYKTEDKNRIMIQGNNTEPYAYEPVLEILNSMVTGQFDPNVAFEHNVDAGSAEKKIIDEVRAWNLKVDTLGLVKARDDDYAAQVKTGDGS